jgi:hypothetical protein
MNVKQPTQLPKNGIRRLGNFLQNTSTVVENITDVVDHYNSKAADLSY